MIFRSGQEAAQSPETDEQHEPPRQGQHAVDPAHLDPHQGDGRLITHLLGEDPSVPEQHNLESQDEQFADALQRTPGGGPQPVLQELEPDVAAALGSDDAMLVRRALLALSAIGAASIDALPHVDAVMSLYANAQTPSDLKMLDAATNAHRSLRGEKPLPPLKVCGVKDVEKSESGVS